MKGLMNQHRDNLRCRRSNRELLRRFDGAVDLAVKMIGSLMRRSARERSWRNVLTGHLNKKTGGKRIGKAGVLLLALAALLLVSCQGTAGDTASGGTAGQASVSEAELALGEIPEYDGEPYVEVEDGEPDFEEDELTGDAYESYSELDGLGRCQEAKACVGLETMPDEERGNIREVKPTGWQSVEYDQVDGGHLYNRCHLIGFPAHRRECQREKPDHRDEIHEHRGMLPFENEVADYVKETGNHVLYQVTPVFEGDNLVASGVWMEAESVEDGGRGVSFNVYVFNIQPGIEIDYSPGKQLGDRRRGDLRRVGGRRGGAHLHPQHEHEEIPRSGLQRRCGYQAGQ